MFSAEEELPAYDRTRRRGAHHKVEYEQKAQRKKSITNTRQGWLKTGYKDANDCLICKVEFDFFVSKRHCKSCGGTVCDRCSQKKLVVPGSSTTAPVRVCNACHLKITKPETLPAIETNPAKPAEAASKQEVKVLTFSTAREVKCCAVCHNLWDSPKGQGFKCKELGIQVHQSCKAILETANELSRSMRLVKDEDTRADLTKGMLGNVTVKVGTRSRLQVL
jgi:hypothetical protein